ncbi:MAG: hypothetical protein AAB334_02270 [Patescibacteria group bacterium]
MFGLPLILVLFFGLFIATLVCLALWGVGQHEFEKEEEKRKEDQKEWKLNKFSKMWKFGEKSFYWLFGSLIVLVVGFVIINS